MRRKSLIICSVVLIFIIILIFSIKAFYKSVARHPLKSNKSTYSIEVNDGENFNTVLNKLNKKGNLKSYYLSKAYMKNEKLNPGIKSGTYSVSKNISLRELMNVLSKGALNKNTIKVTIPEGYELEQIAEELEKKGVITKAQFLKSCKEYLLPEYVKNSNRKYALEGFLFPDTYELKKGVSGEEIITIMLKKFNTILADVEKKNKLNIDVDQIDGIITMSSIIEKEAKEPSERKVISSVFYNRIHIDMKLQSCVTVMYALGTHKDKIYDKDLATPSPYNTYINKGLPVGPICSPGRASIEAAVMPATTNYIYFLSKNNGTHFFTKDYNEFLNAKKQFQGGK